MPECSQILDCQWRDGSFQLWVLQGPSYKCVRRHFYSCFTGAEVIAGELAHISTVQLQSGLVYHIFEATNAKSIKELDEKN